MEALLTGMKKKNKGNGCCVFGDLLTALLEERNTCPLSLSVYFCIVQVLF